MEAKNLVTKYVKENILSISTGNKAQTYFKVKTHRHTSRLKQTNNKKEKETKRVLKTKHFRK